MNLRTRPPQTIKSVKKAFIRCHECGAYTRFRTKQTSPLWVLLAWLFFPFGLLLYYVKRPTNKRPPCARCGNTKSNFTRVFLSTELDQSGKEVAYLAPDGARVQLGL